MLSLDRPVVWPWRLQGSAGVFSVSSFSGEGSPSLSPTDAGGAEGDT